MYTCIHIHVMYVEYDYVDVDPALQADRGPGPTIGKMPTMFDGVKGESEMYILMMSHLQLRKQQSLY